VEASYGTRTWWGREYEDQCCPASAFMDPALLVTAGVGDPPGAAGVALLGNQPNPFVDETMVRFSLSSTARVTLEVYDLLGRRVATRALGTLSPGVHQAPFRRGALGPGLYMYRIKLADPASGVARTSLAGKMMLLK
jgi:hypothetical protein